MSTATIQGAAGSGAAGIVRQGWTEKKIASNPSVSVPVSCTQQATSAEAASNASLSAAVDRSSPPSPTSSPPHAHHLNSVKDSPPSLKRFKRSEEDEIEAGKKAADRGLAHRSTKSGSVMMDKDEEDELESPRRAPDSPSSYQPVHAAPLREGSEFRRTERLPSIAHLDEQIHTPWYHSKRPGIDEGRRYSAHPLLDVPHSRRQASDLSSSSPRMSPFGRSSAVGSGGGGVEGGSSSSTSQHHHPQMRSPRSIHADDGRPTPTLPSPRSIVDDDEFYHHRPMAPHHQHHQQQHPPSLLGRRSRVDFEEHSSFRPSQVQSYPPASSSSSPSTSSLFFEAPNRKRSSPPAPILPSISGLVRPSQAPYHRREEEDDEERSRATGLQQTSPPSQQSRRKVSESDIMPSASSPYSSHSGRLMGRSSNSSSVSNGSTITSSTLPTSRYEPRDESSFYPRPAPSYGSDPRAYASMTSSDSYRHRSSLPLTSRSYSAAYYPSAPAGSAAAAAAAAAAEAEASGVVTGKGRSGGGNGSDVPMGEIPVRSISASYGGDDGGRPVFRGGGDETAYDYEMRRSSLLGPGGPSPSHRHIYHGPRADAHPSPMMGTPTSRRRDDAAMSPVPTSASTSGNPAMPSLGSSVAIPRRRGKLPKPVTDLLKSWLLEHASHPYPTEDEKRRLCSMTGLSISQVSNWFINARRRILVPQGSGTFAMGAGVGSNAPPGAGVDTSDDQERMMLRPSVSPPPHHFHDRLHRHPHEHPDPHQHHLHRNPHHFREEDSP